MLFERRCAGCGRVGWALCSSCLNRLQPARLGARPPAIADSIETFVAATTYDPLAGRLILAAKNGGRRDVLRALAGPLAALVDPGELDAIAWVPTSRVRRRRRGYDQAEVLARAVGHRLGIPTRRFLRRTGSTAQANRNREQRLAGPTFQATYRRPPSSVLLVDDVTTTGASLAAGAAVLRGAGASVVNAAVVAVVDDRRRNDASDHWSTRIELSVSGSEPIETH